ncbi:MAG: translocation/assembly module TamB domain-containing protein [Cyanobacteriota bacterium]
MTHSPNPDNQPQPNSTPRFWLLLLRRGSIALGGILLVGIAGGAVAAWIFIQERLAPLVQTNLKQLLGRPVELGEVESFSLNSLRFASAAIPATPTDPDYVRAEAVDVTFDPLQLLFNRTLELNVTLVKPNAYIEQAEDGRWISTEITTEEKEPGLIKTDVETIRFRNGNVVLVPNPEPGVPKQLAGEQGSRGAGEQGSRGAGEQGSKGAGEQVSKGAGEQELLPSITGARRSRNAPKNLVTINSVSGVARFLEEDQGIRFEVSGEPVKGGSFTITGQTQPDSQQTKIALQAQNLPAATLSQLVQSPVDLQAGRLSGNLTVQLQPNQQLPIVVGTARLNELTANIENIPNPITNIDGLLRFKGQTVAIDNLNARYANAPVQLEGAIGTQTGYNLAAKVKVPSVTNLLNTFKVDLPVAVNANLLANLQVTGPLREPILSGTVETVNSAQIAQVAFSEIAAKFQATPSKAGPEVTFSTIKAIPKVGGQIIGQGTVNLRPKVGVAFTVQAEDVPGDALAKLYGAAPGIAIGEFGAIAKISGSPGNLQAVAQLQAPEATYPATAEVALTPEGVIQVRDAAFKVAGGLVKAEGRLEDGQWQAFVDAEQIQLSRLPQVPQQFQGLFGGEFRLAGTTDSLQPEAIEVTGDARLKVAGGTVNLKNLRFDEGRWQTLVDISQVKLGQLSQQLPQQLQQGQVGGEVRLAGAIEDFEDFDISKIQAQGQLGLQIAGGTVNLRNLRFDQGRLQTLADISQVQLSQLSQQLPEQLQQGRVGGEVRLALTTEDLQDFDLADIQAQGQLGLQLAGGTVNLRNLSLDQGRIQTLADISQVQLGQLSQQLPEQLQQGQLGGEVKLALTTEDLQDFDLADIQAQGQLGVQVAGGTVNLRNLRLDQGRWQTLADISQLQLGQISEQLRGQLGGEVRLAGTTETFDLAAVQAQGQLRLSEGLAALDRPLTAQVRWTGEQLQLLEATAPGLRAQGAIDVQLQEGQAPQIAGLNLDVHAQDYDLQNLPFNLPGNIALAGQVDFTGQVTGTPTTPRAVGDIRLENFQVNNLAFDPVLTGNVAFNPLAGTQLQVSGTQDRIALTLGPNNRPTSFFIRQDEAVATGETQGETLLVDVRDFPINVIENIIPSATANLGPIAGDLTGNVAINLTDFSARGEVAIAQPQLGTIAADEFRGRFTYDQGAATLTAGELRQGENRYSFSGNLQADRQFAFQLNFDEARIENVLQTLNTFGVGNLPGRVQPPDFASAQVLQNISAGLPDTSLLAQLRRLSAIETLLAQQNVQDEDEATPLPSLAELEGTITGEISVTGSLQAGINASFELVGQNWEWGDYTIDEVIAQGTFAEGVVTLLPLRVDLGDALLAYSGQIGSGALNGQLRVDELPVARIKPFLPELPVEASGELNTIVTLAGSLENPTARGEIALAEATINNQPIQTARASFSYADARLNFNSNVLVTGTEPIEVGGSIPVSLPFIAAEPESNQISLVADVQDEGLALLNLFTDRLAWVEGEGEINVAVQGTLNQPIVTGTATVEDAILKVESLPEPLTDVTGRVVFNRDRIIVEGVRAQYEGGQAIAEGVLPIFATQQAQQIAAANPLTVSLDDLDVNLKGLYQGGVSGNVAIAGTALNPAIGGEIRLRDGQIAIGQSEQAASPAADGGTDGEIQPGSSLAFNDLRLILGEDVRITRQPLLSFEAAGDITLNGTLADLRPQGVIRLTGGQVDLFTTQFRLARGYEQTARFTPEGGLDPILDIRLATTVQDVAGSRIAASPFSAEIADVPTNYFGTVDTVRVQARVEGPASELAENLELTSEPFRSEAEIVSLLGGGFANTLGRGDTTQGLVNLAGSTLLSNLQAPITALGEAIGLSELRLYPTIVTDPTTDASVMSLAAEAVVDITNNFSVSVAGVPTADEPFRYNLLYRVNDQILMRGSTNLAGESRALVEYETRF